MLVLKLSFERLLHIEINDDALSKYYMENIILRGRWTIPIRMGINLLKVTE